ncbi:MAG: CvpA family protein [Anaerolineales bacterium]|nr:CvpA family protein [Anaerolineales bacterium]
MVSLATLFWLLVVIFAIIGAMRGWAKELLVTFSIVLSIFIIVVLNRYVPFFQNFSASGSLSTVFWIEALIVVLMAFFGYQTPNLPRLAGQRFARERLQDTLLGFFIGALNGYLLVGTLWFYLNELGYPFDLIRPPVPGDPFTESALELIQYLPPNWLTEPTIYFAVAISFAFVVIVFV